MNTNDTITINLTEQEAAFMDALRNPDKVDTLKALLALSDTPDDDLKFVSATLDRLLEEQKRRQANVNG